MTDSNDEQNYKNKANVDTQNFPLSANQYLILVNRNTFCLLDQYIDFS